MPIAPAISYAPLAAGASPAYGTSGDAVKALQTQLNTQNAGQAGYTPLNVDGKYGPLTQAATQYKAPVTAKEPTAGSVYSYSGGDNANLSNAQNDAADMAKTLAGGGSIVNEDQIRSDTLRSFQAEIDAQNALYATKLNDARTAGLGRVGSDTAIQARRGLLGSDFGAGESATVAKGNQDIVDSINAEKETAIQGILSKARDAGTAAIQAKTLAKTQGLDAYIKNLSDSATTKATTATNIAKDMVAKSTATSIIDPNTLDPATLAKIASSAGVTPDAIKTAYATEKKNADASAATAAAALAKSKKDSQTTLGEGEVLLDAAGNVIGKGPAKTFAPTKLTQTETQQNTINKAGTLFAPGYTIPGTQGVPYVDQSGFATPEGWKTVYRASGLPRQTFIKEFGYLLPPGLESKFGITGAELKIINGITPLPALPAPAQ